MANQSRRSTSSCACWREYSRHTIRAYAHDLQKLFLFFEELGLSAAEFTTARAMEFLHWLRLVSSSRRAQRLELGIATSEGRVPSAKTCNGSWLRNRRSTSSSSHRQPSERPRRAPTTNHMHSALGRVGVKPVLLGCGSWRYGTKPGGTWMASASRAPGGTPSSAMRGRISSLTC
ncbi:site-specific integrase [Alloactinosynnema sp. L-07]|uniref:site-specific integrase n=1 Tax=Alloactinosynnema sp. L-07 TaxID=1653480 RepID=UPI0012F77FB8